MYTPSLTVESELSRSHSAAESLTAPEEDEGCLQLRPPLERQVKGGVRKEDETQRGADHDCRRELLGGSQVTVARCQVHCGIVSRLLWQCLCHG